jgi:K+-sensing histidine kinase KdpD
VATRSGPKRLPVGLALLAPLAIAAVLTPTRGKFENTNVALVLVAVVVGVAAFGNRLPGYLAAISAGVWFNFFFAPPYQQFTIDERPDIQTFVLLMIVGVAVTELAVWGRRQQEMASRRAGYLAGIHAAAETAASSGSAQTLIRQVSEQLVDTLHLQTARYQPGVAGVGEPARLCRDGRITWRGARSRLTGGPLTRRCGTP